MSSKRPRPQHQHPDVVLDGGRGVPIPAPPPAPRASVISIVNAAVNLAKSKRDAERAQAVELLDTIPLHNHEQLDARAQLYVELGLPHKAAALWETLAREGNQGAIIWLAHYYQNDGHDLLRALEWYMRLRHVSTVVSDEFLSAHFVAPLHEQGHHGAVIDLCRLLLRSAGGGPVTTTDGRRHVQYLVNSLIECGEAQEAAASFRRWMAGANERLLNEDVRLLGATAYLHAGQHTDVIALLQPLTNAGHERAFVQSLQALIRNREPDSAWGALQSLGFQRITSPAYLLQLAREFFHVHSNGPGIELLRHILRHVDPTANDEAHETHLKASHMYGNALEARREFHNAAAAYESALLVHPKDPQLLKSLALAYRHCNETAKVLVLEEQHPLLFDPKRPRAVEILARVNRLYERKNYETLLSELAPHMYCHPYIRLSDASSYVCDALGDDHLCVVLCKVVTAYLCLNRVTEASTLTTRFADKCKTRVRTAFKPLWLMMESLCHNWHQLEHCVKFTLKKEPNSGVALKSLESRLWWTKRATKLVDGDSFRLGDASCDEMLRQATRAFEWKQYDAAAAWAFRSHQLRPSCPMAAWNAAAAAVVMHARDSKTIRVIAVVKDWLRFATTISVDPAEVAYNAGVLFYLGARLDRAAVHFRLALARVGMKRHPVAMAAATMLAQLYTMQGNAEAARAVLVNLMQQSMQPNGTSGTSDHMSVL